jgi:hypothetical protein
VAETGRVRRCRESRWPTASGANNPRASRLSVNRTHERAARVCIDDADSRIGVAFAQRLLYMSARVQIGNSLLRRLPKEIEATGRPVDAIALNAGIGNRVHLAKLAANHMVGVEF